MDLIDFSKPHVSLYDLLRRRQELGSIGALEFLIACEQTRGQDNRLVVLRDVARRTSTSKTIENIVRPIRRNQINKKDPDKITSLRIKLLALGFTKEPLVELEAIVRSDESKIRRARAAQVIALWYLRVNRQEDCETALKYIKIAHRNASNKNMLSQLDLAQMLCYAKMMDWGLAHDLFKQLKKKRRLTPDIWLAWANFQDCEEKRIACINQALATHGVPALAVVPQQPEQDLPAYDRIMAAVAPPPVHSGPKVTVLVAAYNCPDTLPTCLRALQRQSWQNLEIIVLDDHSPTLETFEIAQQWAARDRRFKAVRMPENRGAYVARNYGLSIATGDYVTLHDADDWSHPLKIETQAKYLAQHTEIVACMGMQARMNNDLSFTRWSGSCQLIQVNMSSLMFRRRRVMDAIGYWDQVRFGGDSEFIERLRRYFGDDCICNIDEARHSLVRMSKTSAIADEALGFHQFPFGARKIYKELQLAHHDTGQLKYDINPTSRPFPAPRSLISGAKRPETAAHYDVIIVSDFCLPGGTTSSNIQEIECQRMAGLKTAIFPIRTYAHRPESGLNKKIIDLIDGNSVDILAYGENVSCDLLVIRFPPTLYHFNRYVPDIKPKKIVVIANQTPMMDYGGNARLIYDMKHCQNHLQMYFGGDSMWFPIGPQIRDALNRHHSAELQHINLSSSNWSNIINIGGWRRENRMMHPSKKLRIGRISRDDYVKWPVDKDAILSAYPEAEDVEINILGGALVATKIIGYLPSNWIVHEFGSMDPKEFLKDVDVFIYFTSPDWVEAFGRVIIEAMAVGVPVILPEIYRPLFNDAALYATPRTAVEIARRLNDDQEMYDNQAQVATDYILEHFSYNTHLKRLKTIGVKIC